MKLYQKIIGSFLIITTMVGGALAISTAAKAAPDGGAIEETTASPDTSQTGNAAKVKEGISQVGGSTNQGDLPGFITNIINTLLFVVGAIAVIAIIIGAVRFVTSSGDQASVKAARETILYAVVGLVVAIMAFAIVNFVVKNL